MNWKYTRVRCSGKIENFTIKDIFSPEEVKRKMPHSLLFVFIPKSKQVICRESLNYFSDSWAFIDNDGIKQIAARPTTESQACEAIK